MRRLLLLGFWTSVLVGAGAVAFAGATGDFIGYVVAGALACVAVLAVSEMCWSDPAGKTGLLGLVLGKRACSYAQDGDLLMDLREMEVVGVFVVATDLLAYLRGGAGSCLDQGRRREWLDDADLFLSWRAPRKTATSEARQLNDWEAAHERVRLLSSPGCMTVLVDGAGNRLLLPELNPVGRGRAAHPGRR